MLHLHSIAHMISLRTGNETSMSLPRTELEMDTYVSLMGNVVAWDFVKKKKTFSEQTYAIYFLILF